MYSSMRKVNSIYVVVLLIFLSGLGALFYYSVYFFKEQIQVYVKFRNYTIIHKKNYQSKEEYVRRFNNYKESIKEIEYLNKESIGYDPARYGLNKFSDMSKEEFVKTYLSGLNKTTLDESKSTTEQEIIITKQNITDFIKMKKLPAFVDWRSRGVVGQVLFQGSCGGCWAFSAVGTIESRIAIKTGFLPRLSIQQVIDCAGAGNRGCLFGDPSHAFHWLYYSKTVLLLEEQYPLTLINQSCREMQLSGYRLLNNGFNGSFVHDEMKILEFLATQGPVAVSVNAFNWGMYHGGIIQNNCPPRINHAVQLVGYDTSGQVPFYIVRNSWGTDWGNDGYAKIAIGKNECGVAIRAAAPEKICKAASDRTCEKYLQGNDTEFDIIG